jgi:hypothetical protein
LGAGSELDEHVPVGCIEQACLGIVAKGIDELAIDVSSNADESPGPEQSLAQV